MDPTIVLGIASLVVGGGFATLIAWTKSLGSDIDKLREGSERSVASLRDQIHSRVNVLMSEVAELKAMVRELDQYIKHNASDLWAKRDELFEKVSKAEGRLDHVSAELARICKER